MQKIISTPYLQYPRKPKRLSTAGDKLALEREITFKMGVPDIEKARVITHAYLYWSDTLSGDTVDNELYHVFYSDLEAPIKTWLVDTLLICKTHANSSDRKKALTEQLFSKFPSPKEPEKRQRRMSTGLIGHIKRVFGRRKST